MTWKKKNIYIIDIVYIHVNTYIHMEKQLFKFGEASLAFVVPKKWVDKKGLERGSKLFVSENDEGDMVLSTHETAKKEKEIVIDSSFNAKILSGIVGRSYMYGTNILKIRSSDRVSPKQVSTVEKEIRELCPGFEIIKQSEKEITIKDFTDLKEISIKNIIERMKYLVSEQFDAIDSGDVQSVNDSEEIIDRLYKVGFRYANIIRPGRITEIIDIVRRLENMSDNLVVMAENRKDVSEEMKLLKQMFESAFEAYNGNLKSLTKFGDLKEILTRAIKKKNASSIQKTIILRMAGLMFGIAEFGVIY